MQVLFESQCFSVKFTIFILLFHFFFHKYAESQQLFVFFVLERKLINRGYTVCTGHYLIISEEMFKGYKSCGYTMMCLCGYIYSKNIEAKERPHL